jgi:hypothetical protein
MQVGREQDHFPRSDGKFALLGTHWETRHSHNVASSKEVVNFLKGGRVLGFPSNQVQGIYF